MIRFTTSEEGQELLSQRDVFVEAMSPFDRSARMKTDQSVSVEEFLTFAAQHNASCISVTVEGKPVHAVPILFSREAQYDVKQGGEFFSYLMFKFLVVEEQNGIWKPAYRGGNPVLVDVEEISNLFEQIGKNTDYIIHPEEILADNFKLLVMNKRDVPSPTILEMMEALLTQ